MIEKRVHFTRFHCILHSAEQPNAHYDLNRQIWIYTTHFTIMPFHFNNNGKMFIFNRIIDDGLLYTTTKQSKAHIHIIQFIQFVYSLFIFFIIMFFFIIFAAGISSILHCANITCVKDNYVSIFFGFIYLYYWIV